jgi:phosphate-selective porin
LRNGWRFETGFLLVARDFGRHRIAARYDEFRVRPVDQPGSIWSTDKGDAITLGWTWQLREHVELIGEWLRVDSNTGNRALLGEAPHARENSLQFAVRLTL